MTPSEEENTFLVSGTDLLCNTDTFRSKYLHTFLKGDRFSGYQFYSMCRNGPLVFRAPVFLGACLKTP